MKRSPLARVESLLRRVVEEPFTWWAGDLLDPFRLATYLVRHLEDGPADGLPPNHFTIYVHPDDYAELAEDRPADLEAQVGEYVGLLAERRGIRLAEAIRVRFESDPAEQRRRARIVTEQVVEPDEQHTEVFAADSGEAAVTDAIRAVDAFLIVQGGQHVPLDQPVTRLGRRMDNDIVLDAPAISRQHAHIRWRQRYFVLYDVSRHGQTSVNGVPTREHILRSGDVIALGDVLLVYGEGRDGPLAELATAPDEELDTTQMKPLE